MTHKTFIDSPKYRRLILTPSGGMDISDCIREAIIICLTKNCTVSFSHNGTDVEVDPYSFIDPIYEVWKKQREEGGKKDEQKETK